MEAMNDEETCSIGVKYVYHLDESEVQGRIYFRRYSWSFVLDLSGIYRYIISFQIKYNKFLK